MHRPHLLHGSPTSGQVRCHFSTPLHSTFTFNFTFISLTFNPSITHHTNLSKWYTRGKSQLCRPRRAAASSPATAQISHALFVVIADRQASGRYCQSCANPSPRPSPQGKSSFWAVVMSYVISIRQAHDTLRRSVKVYQGG